MSITLNCAWVMYNLGGAIFISHCVCLQRALGATTLEVRSPLASCPGFRKATDPQTLGIRSLVVEALPLHWLSHPGQKPYPSTPWSTCNGVILPSHTNAGLHNSGNKDIRRFIPRTSSPVANASRYADLFWRASYTIIHSTMAFLLDTYEKTRYDTGMYSNIICSLKWE